MAAGLLSVVAVVGIVSANGPTFNIFPIAYNGGLNTDYPLLDGRNSTSGESWSNSQSDHNSGVTANPGEVVEFLIYYHNGAPDAAENTAKDVVAKANIPVTAGNNFTISASLSASNAQTVYSSQKGGDINLKVLGSIPQTISLVPNSTVWMPDRATSQQTMPNTITTSGVSLNDIKGCWDYAGFVKFRVQVSNIQPNADLSIVKTVKNVSDNTGYFNQVNADTLETVEFKIVASNTGDANLTQVKITDSLPGKLTYVSGSQNVSKSHSGNLFSGGVVVSLNAGEQVTLTFRATVAGSHEFPIGTTDLVNTATVQSFDSQFPVGPKSDTAKVVVQRQLQALECPLYPQEGRTIVDFNQTSADYPMVANGSAAQAQRGPVATTLPTDNYKVTLVSYDDHTGKGGQGQTQERYFLKLINSGGSTVASTNSISDLAENQDWLTEQVETNFNIPQTVTSVVAFHTVYPNSGFESIYPICAAFDRIPNVGVTIDKTVKNITTGQGFADSVNAEPSQIVEFKVVVTNTGNVTAQNVKVKDTLPSKLSYSAGTFRVDGASTSDSGFLTSSGVAIGNLVVGQSKTVTFRASIAGQNQFAVGSETLTNTAYTWATGFSTINDMAQVIVEKAEPQKEDGSAANRPQ